MPRKNKMTIEEERAACVMYNNGADIGQISEKMMVGYSTIQRMISDYGLIKKRVAKDVFELPEYKLDFRTKYGLGEINVGESMLLKADLGNVRRCIYYIRKRYGLHFVSQYCGNGMVKITRCK